MTAGSLTRFSEYLLHTGYLQRCVKKSLPCFIYGPAGYLLRKNIEDRWWERMVTKTEACFPVIGGENELHMVYHDFLDFINGSLPFSIAQLSSCNTVNDSVIPKEILPFIDTSTLTNLQMTHFCPQSVHHQTFDQITDTRMRWWKQYSVNSMRFTKTDGETLDKCPYFDITYEFPWGPTTIERIVNKGDNISLEIQEKSKKSCLVGEILPHSIETTLSIDTAVMVYLDDALLEKNCLDKPNVKRQILQLNPALAPFKVALTQHGTKERQLNEVAMYISRMLRMAGIQSLVSRDTTFPIEEQISRNDMTGVPFMVIVTDHTIQTGAIEVRNRDTTIHETLAINKLEAYVTQHLMHQS